MFRVNIICRIFNISVKPVKRNVSMAMQRVIRPDSKIFIQSPFPIIVMPIEYTMDDGENLFIKLNSNCDYIPNISCKIADSNVTVIGTTDKTIDISLIQCVIEMPPTSDIKVHMHHEAGLEVRKLDNKNTRIKMSGTGDILLQNIKSDSIFIETEGGDVESMGFLEAQTIKIRTAAYGDIRLHNASGTSMVAETWSGHITTNTCECKQSHFITSFGNLKLKNVHNICTIETQTKKNTLIYGSSHMSTLISSCKLITIEQVNESDSVSHNPIALKFSEQPNNHFHLLLNSSSMKCNIASY